MRAVRSHHNRAAKSKEVSVQHQAHLNSRRLWASRWIQVSNKVSFLVRRKAHQAAVLRLLSQDKTRRQPYGKRNHMSVKGTC